MSGYLDNDINFKVSVCLFAKTFCGSTFHTTEPWAFLKPWLGLRLHAQFDVRITTACTIHTAPKSTDLMAKLCVQCVRSARSSSRRWSPSCGLRKAPILKERKCLSFASNSPKQAHCNLPLKSSTIELPPKYVWYQYTVIYGWILVSIVQLVYLQLKVSFTVTYHYLWAPTCNWHNVCHGKRYHSFGQFCSILCVLYRSEEECYNWA